MRRWMVLVGLVAVAISVLGRVVARQLRGVEVSEAVVERGRVVAAVYATGRLDTDRRATLRVRVAAPLAALLVGPGEEVREGQVVARQDEEVMRLARARAEREVEAARASLAQVEDLAMRLERLAADALVAEEEVIRAREQVRQLRAQLSAQEAALELALEQERWTTLRAPMSGAVAEIHHRAGDPLREGDEVLTVVDLADAYLRVAVDERDVGRIAVGQPVRIAFDAYPDTLLEGSVWRLVPTLDRLTKTVDVLVRLPDQGPPRRLGLTATVNIVTQVVEEAVLLPREAIGGTGKGSYAMGVDTRRRAVRRPLQLGVCDELRCQVLSGVAVGDRIISPLPPSLAEGQRVRLP